jgi:hypothetical protein
MKYEFHRRNELFLDKSRLDQGLTSFVISNFIERGRVSLIQRSVLERGRDECFAYILEIKNECFALFPELESSVHYYLH